MDANVHILRSGVQRVQRIARQVSPTTMRARERSRRIAAAQHRAWARTLSLLLHEPERHCRRIARANLRFTAALDRTRFSRQSADQIRDRSESITWLQEAEYRAFCQHHRGSHILATTHFGDYVHCLNPLAGTYSAGGATADGAAGTAIRHLIIREKWPDRVSLANLSDDFSNRAVAPPQILISSQVNVLMLRDLLRTRVCTLTSFFDLPASHGAVVPVTFLGQPAWFSAGVASLAITAAVPIVPVVTYSRGRRNHLVLGPLLMPEARYGERFPDTRIRITQSLINWHESWLRRYPEQWRYLPNLPAYFKKPGVEPHDFNSKAKET